MYKEDMGYRIMYLRKYVCGYSQRRLAKLVNEDIEKSVSDVEAIICAEKNKVTRYKNNIIDKFKEEL